MFTKTVARRTVRTMAARDIHTLVHAMRDCHGGHNNIVAVQWIACAQAELQRRYRALLAKPCTLPSIVRAYAQYTNA